MYEFNLLIQRRLQDVKFRAACAGAKVEADDEPKPAGDAAFHAHLVAIAKAHPACG